MKIFWMYLWVLVLTVPMWAIGTEGRSPDERPDWWKPYEGATPIQVSPDVVPPKGEVPAVVEEAVTRNAERGVPETLVVSPEGASGTVGLPKAIDGEQVMQSATEDANRRSGGILRGFALFAGFLLFGGGAVFGLIRWWSAQVPEPPKPSRRARF